MSSSQGTGVPGYLSEPTSPDDNTNRYEGTGGLGWVAFAGMIVIIVGFVNLIYGIAAIDGARFYADEARFIFGDLETWGWVHVVLGSIQFCAGFAILFGSNLGRWIGVVTAGVNAVTQLLFIDAFPLLAVAIVGLDILVLYGLVAHGGRRMADV